MERVNFKDLSVRKEKHGMSRTTIYSVWRDMRRRCDSPNDKRYKHYGGRGISVCLEWNSSFIKFHDDMCSTYKYGLEIDRIDNNGNYNKDNCRWIDKSMNNANRRSTRSKLLRGVRPNCNGLKFQAKICVYGEQYFLGTFDTELEAHNAYSEMRFEWYGIR